MIFYETGSWQLMFVFSCGGSVIPRAFVVATPASILAVVLNWLYYGDGEYADAFATQAWYACTFLLSFLVVFRTQQAYSRFWEGVTLLHKAKGDWLNATSCIMAFCTEDPDRKEEVYEFQHYIVRLMSLLHCAAMQQVTYGLGHDEFEVLDFTGLEQAKLDFLVTHPDNQCLILMQWVQRSIVKSVTNDLLPIAPPIMSRAFQQLGDGYTNLIDAQKITDIPFPFPFAQMVTLLLMVASLVTPCICAFNIESKFAAGGFTFLSVFGFWSLNYIAGEIERPFGDDANDLPIDALQCEMNRDLKVLLDVNAQSPPSFSFDRERHEQLEDVPYGELTTTVRASVLTKYGFDALPVGLQSHLDNRPAARQTVVARKTVRQKMSQKERRTQNLGEARLSKRISSFSQGQETVELIPAPEVVGKHVQMAKTAAKSSPSCQQVGIAIKTVNILAEADAGPRNPSSSAAAAALATDLTDWSEPSAPADKHTKHKNEHTTHKHEHTSPKHAAGTREESEGNHLASKKALKKTAIRSSKQLSKK